MLRVENVSKRYGRNGERAVRDVSFVVPTGGFFTLLGPSGCGKTTTLRCVAGLERPDTGEITLDDQVLFSSKRGLDRPPHRRKIGMVFQSYAIWPHMTVGANIRYPLEAAKSGLSKSEIALREQSVLERMGLAGLGERWATQLSGGQQQRLALGRALIASPGLLLLDEPLSNLDAKLRTSMRAELRATQRDLGVTALYVTHDQAEALSISDIVAVVHNGVIEQVGTPREIYDAPSTEFVADFIGQANLFPGRRLDDRAVSCGLGSVAVARHVESPDATVCVRPENVRLLDPDTSPLPTANVFHGRVTDVEFVGNAQTVAIESGGVSVRALAAPAGEVRVGDEVDFHLPVRCCHPISAAVFSDGLADALAPEPMPTARENTEE
jgi:iron(III) transport system ATP-binding protein